MFRSLSALCIVTTVSCVNININSQFYGSSAFISDMITEAAKKHGDVNMKGLKSADNAAGNEVKGALDKLDKAGAEAKAAADKAKGALDTLDKVAAEAIAAADKAREAAGKAKGALENNLTTCTSLR